MLDFKHTIQIEIHNDAYPSVVKFFINNDLKHEKIYDPGTHNDSISFNHLYTNGNKNKLLLSYNAKAETEAKVATATAKATIMKKVAAGEMEWNQTWAEGAQSSWKDEWLTILVSIPLILAFTGYEDVVMRGFNALEAMPD